MKKPAWAAVGLTALLCVVAWLGSLALRSFQGERAEASSHSISGERTENHGGDRTDRMEPASVETSVRQVPRAGGGLTVRIEAEHRSFAPFCVRVLDPVSGEERGRSFVEREASWSDLPTPEVVVSVTAPGWKSVERRSPSRGAVAVAMEPLSLLAGHTLDAESGDPIRAFRLRLEHRVASGDGPPTVFAHQQMDVEDEEGAFSVAGLPVEGKDVRLVCQAQGRLEGATERFPVGVWAEGLVIALQTGDAGRAWITGKVVGGPERRAVPGAQVVLVRAEAGIADALSPFGSLLVARPLWPAGEKQLPSARSAEDGSFAIETSAEGALRPIAFHPEWGLALGEEVQGARGRTAEVAALVFEPGKALVVRLRGRDDPTSLSVQVSGGGGERSAHPGADGIARFAGLVPGPYDVRVTDGFVKSSSQSAFQPRLLEARQVEVGAEPETELTIDLGTGSGTTLLGTLVAPDDETWLWQVVLLDLDTKRSRGATLLENGGLEVEGVGPGRYALVGEGIAAGGVRSALIWHPLLVADAQSPPFVELSAPGCLEVHDPRVDLESEATLFFEPEDPDLTRILGGRPRGLMLDAEGECLIYGLPPGRVVLEREGSRVERRLAPGEHTRIDLGDKASH